MSGTRGRVCHGAQDWANWAGTKVVGDKGGKTATKASRIMKTWSMLSCVIRRGESS